MKLKNELLILWQLEKCNNYLEISGYYITIIDHQILFSLHEWQVEKNSRLLLTQVNRILYAPAYNFKSWIIWRHTFTLVISNKKRNSVCTTFTLLILYDLTSHAEREHTVGVLNEVVLLTFEFWRRLWR